MRLGPIIDEYGMIACGDLVVAGFSAGSDSTALLHALAALRRARGFEIVAVHVDHGLRSSSAEDALWAVQFAESMGIRCVVERVDARGRAREHGVSIEEAGRRERRRVLTAAADKLGARRIALAHHRDDSVETFFLRALRGSSLQGLGGIAAVADRVIRPLIRFTKAEILEYLLAHGLQWREDETNREIDPERNFIRNCVLPLISGRFPGYRRTVSRTMELLAQENEVLDTLARDLLLSARTNDEGPDLAQLRNASPVLAKRALLLELYRVSGPHARWTAAHVEAIFRAAVEGSPSGTLDLPAGLAFTRNYERIYIAPHATRAHTPYTVRVDGPCVMNAPHFGQIEFSVCEDGVRLDVVSGDCAYFDGDIVDFPLEVRTLLPGDRIAPWGMEGSRKLKRLFIDLKYPARKRWSVPLVVKNGEILWVGGVRRSRTAPVTQGTRRILVMKRVKTST